jgi:hypothetical protein
MLYTKHITLTDNTEQSLLTIPNGFVAHVKVHLLLTTEDLRTVDLVWETGVPEFTSLMALKRRLVEVRN